MVDLENPEIPSKSQPQILPTRRELLKGIFAVAAACSTAVAVTLGEKEEKDVALRIYNNTREVFQEEKFEGPEHTVQRFEALIDLFKKFVTRKTETFTYYDLKGKSLFEVKKPKNWDAMEPEDKQKWHNANRTESGSQKLVLPNPNSKEGRKQTGYPLVGIPYFKNPKVGEAQEVDAVKELNTRLDDKLQDKRYFNGEETSLREAIRQIADAYGVPYLIAVSVAANESGLRRAEKSDADAKGLFQFLEETSNEAKGQLKTTPIRSGAIGNYEDEINNRFVQTELFCAEYLFMMNVVTQKAEEGEESWYLEKLENRIKEIDPAFNADLTVIATLNAYCTGPGNIKAAIDDFCQLSDEQIKARIGEGPYGQDLWLGVIGESFGKNNIGTHSMFYPARVYAHAAALAPEEDLLAGHRNTRPAKDATPSEEIEADEPQSETTKTVSTLLAIGSATAAIGMQIQDTLKRRKTPSIPKEILNTRQQLIMYLGISMIGLTGGASLQHCTNHEAEPIEVSAAEGFTPSRIELSKEYEAAREKATEKLKDLYKELKANGSHGSTKAEKTQRRKYKMPQQNALMADVVEDWFGVAAEGEKETALEKFRKNKKKATKHRKKDYDSLNDLQKKQLNAGLKSGEIIKMDIDNPLLPYFCEQIGKTSGTKNDSEALYMRAEFLPILQITVDLINVQIDLFNEDPAAFGYGNHPKLAHISAIKVSGAYRPMDHQYKLLKRNPSSTTRDISMHTTAHALDIGSLATPNANVVRFAEDFTEAEKKLVVAGEKLPTKKDSDGTFGDTRDILSRMIGRSLMNLEEPLKQETSIRSQPLWEQPALNWHMLIRP